MNADSGGHSNDERDDKVDIRWDEESVDNKSRPSEPVPADSRIEWDGKQWDWDSVMFLAQPIPDSTQKNSNSDTSIPERETSGNVSDKSTSGIETRDISTKIETYPLEESKRSSVNPETRVEFSSSKLEKGAPDSSVLPSSSLVSEPNRRSEAEKQPEPVPDRILRLGDAGKGKRQRGDNEERISSVPAIGQSTMAAAPGAAAVAAAANFQPAPGCQVEGCKSDLANSKEYHKRHKVCEIHSKASAVMVLGQIQRFCQQCSRFHLLSEFDEGKRSCRRRLLGHNKRRRKTVPITDRVVTTHPSMAVSHLMHSSTTDMDSCSKSGIGMESGNFQQRIMSIISQGNTPQDMRELNFGFGSDLASQIRFDPRTKHRTDSTALTQKNPTSDKASVQASSPNVDSLFPAMKRSAPASYSTILQSNHILPQSVNNPSERAGGQSSFAQRLFQDVPTDTGLTGGTGTVMQHSGSPPPPILAMPSGLVNRGMPALESFHQVHSPQSQQQQQQQQHQQQQQNEGIHIHPLLGNAPNLLTESSSSIPSTAPTNPSRTAQLLFPMSVSAQTDDASASTISEVASAPASAGSAKPPEKSNALLYGSLSRDYDPIAFLSALKTRQQHQQQPFSHTSDPMSNHQPSAMPKMHPSELNRFLDVMPMPTQQQQSQQQFNIQSQDLVSSQEHQAKIQEQTDAMTAALLQDGNDPNAERPGNISFKLFDRNPSDFPITLRQQILEWLAHRPQDMESYIRPGCVILTIHLSMPQSSWTWITSNFHHSLQKLMRGEGGEFWRKGKMIVQVERVIAVIVEGIIKDITFLRIMDAPYIKSLSPLAVIAGEKTKITIKGLNLCYPATLIFSINGRCTVKNLNNQNENYDTYNKSNGIYDINSKTFVSDENEEWSGILDEEIEESRDEENKKEKGKTEGEEEEEERQEMFYEHEIEFHTNLNNCYGRCFVEVSNGEVCSNSCFVLVVDEDMCHELRTLEDEVAAAGDKAAMAARLRGHSQEEIARIRIKAESKAEAEVRNFMHEFGGALYSLGTYEKQLPNRMLPFDLTRMHRLMEFARKRGWVCVSQWLCQSRSRLVSGTVLTYDTGSDCSFVTSNHNTLSTTVLYDYKLAA